MFVFLWKTIRNKDELEEFLSEDSKWYKGAYGVCNCCEKEDLIEAIFEDEFE